MSSKALYLPLFSGKNSDYNTWKAKFTSFIFLVDQEEAKLIEYANKNAFTDNNIDDAEYDANKEAALHAHLTLACEG